MFGRVSANAVRPAESHERHDVMPLLSDLQRLLSESMRELSGARMPASSDDVDAPPLWQLSSFELMNGVDVEDFSETLSGDAFNALFRC